MPVIKDVVKERYKNAAKMPQSELCCPKDYDFKALEKYIPKEVLDVSYGCGTPAGLSSVRPGEAVLDIGSGGGIDCFEAARLVGAEGKVIGIDMTDNMLAIARRNAPKVAENLGLPVSVLSFKKGEAENLPLDNAQFDLVISNCVINLSPDKEAAFEEIFRVLRPGGRFTISDIVSDQPVPQYLKHDEDKWGACLSGSLETAEYLKVIREAGFIGVEQLKFSPWQRVDGIHFYSVTVKGVKPSAKESAHEVYRYAVYRGPFLKIKDERGNAFQRGQSKKISPETSELLCTEAYRPYFILMNEVCDTKSITDRLYVQLPEGQMCSWRGDYAILSSLFLTAEDDDHHIFYAGQPLEICDRTKKLFSIEHYRPFFAILNRAESNDRDSDMDRLPKVNCC